MPGGGLGSLQKSVNQRTNHVYLGPTIPRSLLISWRDGVGNKEGGEMSERLFALLIHDRREPFDDLRRTLKDLSIETYSVETCQEAKTLISQCRPQIIFTENSLPDGSWVSIQEMAEEAAVPLSVIVVGKIPDTRHYLSVMERGAFDFVAPPFEHKPLSCVVQSAAKDVHRRREASAQRAFA